MKKIFVYYSNSGNGDEIAKYLKEKNYNIEKIITKNPLPKNKILSILIGGYKAAIGYKDKIEKLKNNIEEYEEILIGSPIWNGRLSSPINSLLSDYSLDNKKITFILYSASGSPNKATIVLKNKYPNATIINLKEPKKYKEELEKLK